MEIDAKKLFRMVLLNEECHVGPNMGRTHSAK